MPFKTLSHSSRYDFRFLRYHRAKTRVNFNRSLSSICSRLLLPNFVSKLIVTSEIAGKNVVRVSRKIYRSMSRWPIHDFCTCDSQVNGYFTSPYKISANQLKYQKFFFKKVASSDTIFSIFPYMKSPKVSFARTNFSYRDTNVLTA